MVTTLFLFFVSVGMGPIVDTPNSLKYAKGPMGASHVMIWLSWCRFAKSDLNAMPVGLT